MRMEVPRRSEVREPGQEGQTATKHSDILPALASPQVLPYFRILSTHRPGLIGCSALAGGLCLRLSGGSGALQKRARVQARSAQQRGAPRELVVGVRLSPRARPRTRLPSPWASGLGWPAVKEREQVRAPHALACPRRVARPEPRVGEARPICPTWPQMSGGLVTVGFDPSRLMQP